MQTAESETNAAAQAAVPELSPSASHINPFIALFVALLGLIMKLFKRRETASLRNPFQPGSGEVQAGFKPGERREQASSKPAHRQRPASVKPARSQREASRQPARSHRPPVGSRRICAIDASSTINLGGLHRD